MTDLRHSLLNAEFSYLKVVAENWEIPFSAPDARQGVDQLVELLFASRKLEQLGKILKSEEVEALIWLDEKSGQVAWDRFTRRFGELREIGAGRLDRERPDQEPISPVEELWYRALIARGFFDTGTGPQEFVYIPDDIREAALPNLNPDRKGSKESNFQCRKAAPAEKKVPLPTKTAFLDHICTLLAGLRMGLDPAVHLPESSGSELAFIQGLLIDIALIDNQLATNPENVRNFFELPRAEALSHLWNSWWKSVVHQDLGLVPGIQIEGDPEMDPVRVRAEVVANLASLNSGDWWSIESFTSQIKEINPDFLRTGGDFDSWFIKNTDSGDYLAGFSFWDSVEGALIRYLITGPLFWFGMVDLAGVEENEAPLAFRKTELFSDLYGGNPPNLPVGKPDLVQIRSKGELRMSVDVPHKARYQIARFCDWGPIKAEAYLYTITPASLTRAEKQGLRAAHLLSLLKNHTEGIPPNILSALERWEKQGIQASIAPKLVMRLGSPAVLKALKKSKASRYILEQLGPTVVIIREGSAEKISEALVELGFFVGVEDQSDSQT